MKVREIMTENPESASPGTLVGDVARMMRDLDVGIIPIVANGELMGVITDRDITIRVVAAGLNPLDVTVQNFVSPNPVTISPGDDVKKAAQLMADNQIRRLMVVDNDKLVGVLSLGDLATDDSQDREQTADVLEEISEPVDLDRISTKEQ